MVPLLSLQVRLFTANGWPGRLPPCCLARQHSFGPSALCTKRQRCCQNIFFCSFQPTLRWLSLASRLWVLGGPPLLFLQTEPHSSTQPTWARLLNFMCALWTSPKLVLCPEHKARTAPSFLPTVSGWAFSQMTDSRKLRFKARSE